MNSVVEKLAAIEKEVAAIQPKMAPLTERIADLDQKVAGFAQQLSGIAEESAAVKQDIELTRQSLTRIQTLIGESKVESEQLVAGQAENLQRCETMTAVFGAAFQAVSQFFETAQRMGLADQAKAVFLPLPGDLPPPLALDETPSEPQPEDAVETADGRRQTAEETTESAFSEAAFESALDSALDSALSGADEADLDPWPASGLPDVASPPDIASAELDSGLDSGEEADSEPASEMATQLEVPPLNLATPDLPKEDGAASETEMDDQEIEDLLASMMTPVTATAGN